MVWCHESVLPLLGERCHTVSIDGDEVRFIVCNLETLVCTRNVACDRHPNSLNAELGGYNLEVWCLTDGGERVWWLEACESGLGDWLKHDVPSESMLTEVSGTF